MLQTEIDELKVKPFSLKSFIGWDINWSLVVYSIAQLA
jgi:hypothetical protein